MSRARPSKEVLKARVSEIVKILLDGAQNLDVAEYISTKEAEPGPWFVPDGSRPLSYSQVRRDIAKAEELIGECAKEDRQKLLNRHLAQRRRLYAAAVSQGDVRAALSVLADEANLLGLYPARKTTHEPNDMPSLSTLVQVLIKAEAGAKVSISTPEQEPQQALAIFEAANESAVTAGDATPAIGSQEVS